MLIKRYIPSMSRDIADLFYGSVHHTGQKHYTKAQLQAWAPSPVDYDFWHHRLAIKCPYVAILNDTIVGFMELDEDGYIDCAYTHKDYQRQGVARSLFHCVEQAARLRSLKQLSVDASLMAQPFFEKQGFKVCDQNLVERAGEHIINIAMIKAL